jgi:importin subunit beta-1
MAGGTCLGLVATAVKDEIVPLVMPFIEGNITKPDWRSREAATFAFGAILEGPSVVKLAPLVHAGFDFLLNATKDQNNHVRETTAWALSRTFEFLHSPAKCVSVVTDANLSHVVEILLASIKDSPNVAEKVCGALYFLAQGYNNAGSMSSVLSPYFGQLVSALLATADRSDSNNSRLCASAYETLNEIVRCSSVAETVNMIVLLLQEILKRLSQTFEFQITSPEDKEKQSDLQALLCGAVQVILQKFSNCDDKSVIVQFADQIMVLFLRVFSCDSSNVHEEAMLAIGALAYATGPDFLKYMPEFHKYLEMGLQNFGAYQVCCVSVGVVIDICRALDDKVLPYCDGIMGALLKDLSSPELHRSVKPPILSCIGDIALTIGEHFEKYVPYTMPMLQGAAELCSRMDLQDDDSTEYQNELRQSIFEAYSGILQGVKISKSELMVPYAANIFHFAELVLRDTSSR